MNTAAAKQAIAKIGIHFTNCSFIVILSFPALRAYSLFLLLLVLFIGVKKAECNSHVQTQAHSQYLAMSHKMVQQVLPLPAAHRTIAFRFQLQFILARSLDHALSLPQI